MRTLVVAALVAAALVLGLGRRAAADPDLDAANQIMKDLDKSADDTMAKFERDNAERQSKFERDSAERRGEFEHEQNVMILCFVIVASLMVGVTVIAKAAKRDEVFDPNQYEPPYTPPVVPDSGTDVCVLRIAIDGRASKFVRAELARIEQLADAATPGGRLARLRETTVLLRRVRDAWVYGGAVNEPMRATAAAMTAFRGHVDDARTRLTRGAPGEPASEGQSLILISIVVAANGELATVGEIGAGEDLRRALESASHRLPEDLLAVQIVALPADPEATMSSLQLAAAYPPPDLYPIQSALVGKAFCTYCGGPFPAELVTCPHCGGPAPGREAAALRTA